MVWYRYSDIIVHRLLAVAIGADSTYPALMDKHKQAALCNNLNYRHKMAQYAQRASVAFHTQVGGHLSARVSFSQSVSLAYRPYFTLGVASTFSLAKLVNSYSLIIL